MTNKPIVDSESASNTRAATSPQQLYMGPQVDSSVKQDTLAALASRPEDLRDFLHSQFGDKVGFVVYNGEVIQTTPERAEAFQSAKDVQDAINSGFAKPVDHGMIGSLIANGPEIALQGLGAAYGTTVMPGYGTVAGAGFGAGTGNLIKQGIGKLLGVDQRPVLDADRAKEAAVSTALGSLGEGLGLATKGATGVKSAVLPENVKLPFVPEAINKPIQGVGKVLQTANEAVNSPFANALVKENQAQTKNMIQDLVAKNAKTGFSDEVASNSLDLNKALSDALEAEYSKLKSGQLGTQMNKFKAEATPVFDPSELLGKIDELAQNSSNEVLGTRANKIGQILNRQLEEIKNARGKVVGTVPPSIGDVIERFQNLKSGGNFYAPNDEMLNKGLQGLRKDIGSSIDANIASSMDEEKAKIWKTLNDAYAKTIEGGQAMKEAVDANKNDYGRETLNKIIDNPRLGYESSLAEGAIPPRTENLASRAFIQERLADKLGREGKPDAFKDLEKLFSNPKKVDELKNIIGTDSDYVLNQLYRELGIPEVETLPTSLKSSNTALVDELQKVLSNPKNILAPEGSKSLTGTVLRTAGDVGLNLSPLNLLNQAYYNPYGLGGRLLTTQTGMSDRLMKQLRK